MKENNKRVLIVGADSFTGGYLSHEFEHEGYQVFGTVLSGPEKENYYTCNILEPATLMEVLERTRPDYICHLAARSFVADKNAKEFYNVNLFGTLNLLDAVIKCGLAVDKIVIASSANIYGPTDRRIIGENVPANPVNHYSLSKYAMEQMAKGYFKKLNIMLVRPFNYTGVGQSELFIIPKIVNHFREKKNVIQLGNIDVARDFSDVRDVARAYRIIMESSITSDVINICSSEAVTIREIIAMAEKITGYNIEIQISNELIRSNDIHYIKGDNTKVNSLGFTRRYSLNDTMEWMFK